jgi:Cu2+-containing amine oxidase
VNAQFHQHFFAVRLDTEFDGNQNTVSTVDVVPSSGKNLKHTRIKF